MTGMTPAERIGAVAARIARDGIAGELADDLVARTVDVVGNCLAALREGPAGIVGAVVQEWGGNGAATGFGRADLLPAPSAALLNGTLAHSLDFDDTHLPSVLHPSSSVVPAALAAAERFGAGGPAMLAAAAVGVEVTCRLGMAGYDEELGNSVFFERGQHATAICGAVGAAVAAGMLAGLDATGLTSVIGIAASMGAGIIEANRTGGTIKRVHCGWAAHAGVAAADLARHGLTGPPTVIEGRFGFLQAFCGDRVHVERVTDGLAISGRPRASSSSPTRATTSLTPVSTRRSRCGGTGCGRSRCGRSPSGSRRRCCAPSPSRPRRRPGRDPATTRRSAAPTRWPRHWWVAAGWGCSTRTSPIGPPPIRSGWSWPPGCAVSPTRSRPRSSRGSSRPC